jgi:integrase
MPLLTRAALTKTIVDNAKATGKLYRLRDASVPGLLLRVNATGRRTWAVTWGRGQERILGSYPEVPLGTARELALKALAQTTEHGAPLRDESKGTVAGICRAYVSALRKDGRETAAKDAERRFERTIYADRLGKLNVSALTHREFRDWRDRVELGDIKLPKLKGRPPAAKPLAKATVNRMRTVLVAALNKAVEDGDVSPERAREWERVKPHENAGKRRELYLDRKQRRALLANATPDVRDLMECIALTGCRPGDPAAVLRRDYDAKNGLATFRTKGHERSIPLGDKAKALFDRLAEGKKPAAHMFTHDDKPWQAHEWHQPVRDAAAAAELPDDVVLYTLRHCWITDAITGGMDLLTVAKMAGTSLAMIEKHYGKLVQETAREKLAKVEFL